MDILNVNFIKGFIRMGMEGYNNGWHERNGGNLTYRMTENDVKEVSSYFNDSRDWCEIGTSVPGLALEYFLTSGSGKFFKNFEIDAEDSMGIIQIDDKGEKYKILWGLSNRARPTSELSSHLMNHEVKKSISGGKHRVIYHAHTTNIIALTFILPLEDRVFTRELWEMATECPVVFPQGVGIVKWMVPGGKEIAIETSKLMKKYDVAIWAHHGTFCSGENFDLTFGLMDTVEKAAEILVKVMSMSTKKHQTIEPDDFRKLANDFQVSLSDEFLYKK